MTSLAHYTIRNEPNFHFPAKYLFFLEGIYKIIII